MSLSESPDSIIPMGSPGTLWHNTLGRYSHNVNNTLKNEMQLCRTNDIHLILIIRCLSICIFMSQSNGNVTRRVNTHSIIVERRGRIFTFLQIIILWLLSLLEIAIFIFLLLCFNEILKQYIAHKLVRLFILIVYIWMERICHAS